MGFISEVLSGLKSAILSALRWIKEFFRKVINGILNFARDIVAWYRGRSLKQGKDIPFILRADSFKELIKNAPVKDVGIFSNEQKNVSVMSGIYNEEIDEITDNQIIEADSLDAKTREVLGNEEIVVLN